MANSKGLICPEEYLNCTICLEIFRCPRSLPCLHTFCEPCLQSYINKATEKNELKDGKFVCPVCRTPTDPPVSSGSSSSWAKLFPPNYALLSLLKSANSKKAPVCDSCTYHDITREAEKFCKNCKEHLCMECVKCHQSFKATRNHQLVSFEEVGQPGKTATIDLDYYCQSHNDKILEYFCKDDNSLCCSTCAIVNHRKCQEVVEISTVASTSTQDKQSEKTGETMKEFLIYFRSIIEIIDTEAKEFDKQLQSIPVKIQELRAKVTNLLDMFEENITSEIQSVRKSASMKKEEQLSNYQRIVLSIENAHAQLEYVLKHGNDAQIFITLQRAAEQALKCKKEVKQSHEHIVRSTVELVIPHQINALLGSTIDGKLEIKHPSLSLPQCTIYESTKQLKDCPVVYVGSITAAPPEITRVRFTGASCLPDGRIAIADEKNWAVHLYDSSFTHKHSTSLGKDVWQIKCLNKQQLAVCCKSAKEIHLIDVDKSLTSRRIQTTSSPLCIDAVGQDTLAVVLDNCNSTFITLSMDGTETSRFSQDKSGRKFEVFWFMTLTRDKTRVLQSCYNSNALYCFTLDGTPCFTYRHPELRFPSGVDLDQDGNIYVCGLRSSNIHQLTPHGQLIRIIKADGMTRPLKLCFFPNGTEFFVTENTGAKINKFRIEDKP